MRTSSLRKSAGSTGNRRKQDMLTPRVEHPHRCPGSNVGHQIVASITIPDVPGFQSNRYAVVAFDRSINEADLYCTWVIAPYMVDSAGTACWSGDSGHYSMTYLTALKDM